MPDTTAIAMTADVLNPNPGPAHSATSDMPGTVSATEATEGQATETEQTDQAAEEAGVEAAEPPVEAHAEETEPKTDKTDPAVKAAITRERNRRREAEARATDANTKLSQALAALEAATKKPEPQASDRPKRDDFNDPDAYEAALETYAADRATKQALEQERSRLRTDGIKAQAEKLINDYAERVTEFKKTHDDFDEVFCEDVPVTPAMTSAIMNVDNGADVAYWLGQNPDEAKRIAELSDVRAVTELGRISAKLANPPAVVTKAKPAPIRPVGQQSGSTAKDPAEMSTDEYAAYRNQQLRGSGGQSAVH